MTDYDKFEKLIEEDEEREKKEKEEERTGIRLKHENEQKEKQKAWDAKLIEQGKDPVKERQKYGGCAFSQMNHLLHSSATHAHDGHSHENGHSGDHDHDHQPSGSSKSSCGYMPVDQFKQLSAQKKDELSVEEKNKKKIAAVYAAKEDANRLFKEQKYDVAYKVYERGSLIINGMYDLNESDETEMEKIECLLDLNMALVSLKRQEWTQAIDCCKMAIQIDDRNAKAYYRWSEALIAMSEYDEARKQSLKAKELEPNNIGVDRQLERIDTLQKEQLEKAKKEEQKIAQRIRHRMQKKKRAQMNDSE